MLVGLLFSVIFSFVNFSAECDKTSRKILRLHVIANSDSEEDQNLKLRIRDKIINYFGNKNLKSLNETKKFAINNLDEIELLCQNEVNDRGYNYKVKMEICKSNFNTRTYENLSLPAGQYESLRVTIGNGEGRNWWCVIFPPMCIPAAEESSLNKELCKKVFLCDDQTTEPKVKYKIKFKFLELYDSFQGRILNFSKKFLKFSSRNLNVR